MGVNFIRNFSILQGRGLTSTGLVCLTHIVCVWGKGNLKSKEMGEVSFLSENIEQPWEGLTSKVQSVYHTEHVGRGELCYEILNTIRLHYN